MISDSHEPQIAVLVSGGLDSSVLLAHLASKHHHRVQPLYIRTQLRWEAAELAAARQFIAAVNSPSIAELITLDMPLGDLYRAEHWSLSGQRVPGAETADNAVMLPGRNPLLLIKAIVWCQLHGCPRLAVATLVGNPFADSTDAFFAAFEAALNMAGEQHVSIECPFAEFDKRQVLQLGRDLPLQLTFSCIDPVDSEPCGQCNKCAERQRAFDGSLLTAEAKPGE